jgi:putative endonuclease
VCPPREIKARPKRKFVRRGRFFVYILECSDGTYYTGFTPDLPRRISLHNSGKGAKYTRNRRPVRLVWKKRHRYFKHAVAMEYRIKELTRRQKTLLVRGELAVFANGKFREAR